VREVDWDAPERAEGREEEEGRAEDERERESLN